MNNKAFIRSIEVILAILLFMGFYTLSTEDLTPNFPESNPSTSIIELFTCLEQTSVLNQLINTYSMNEILSNLKHLLPSNKGYNIELNYFEPLNVKNYNNEEVNFNISFIRTFPQAVNLQSVKVYDEEKSLLPVQVINNFYEKEVTIQADQTVYNDTITLSNIRLQASEDEAINTTSLRAYVNNERVNLTLNSIDYNTEPYDANTSITLLIPYANKGDVLNTFIFFAVNESETLAYPDYETGLTMPYTESRTKQSKTSEVRFTITLSPNEENNAMLYYELNTDVSRTFPSINTNFSNINVQYRDEYYKGTTPLISYEPPKTYNINKLLITDEFNCLINLRVWDYE